MEKMKKEYSISWDNTSIAKLHMLARNGVLSYSTVNNIVIDKVNSKIRFRSKHTYSIFMENEYSSIAMFKY